MSQPLEKQVRKLADWMADTNPILGHILAVVEEDGRCRVGNGVSTFSQLLNMNPSGIKIYRALLTQTGTDAPVVTEFENTLNGTVVWTRVSVGLYRGTLAGAFPDANTVLQTPVQHVDLVNDAWVITQVTTDYLEVSAYDGGVPADGAIDARPLSIIVYP